MLKGLSNFFDRADRIYKENKVIKYTLLAIVVIFITRCMIQHYQIVTADFQLEMREGGNLFLTDGILKGIFPYFLENEPIHTTPYGLIYHFATIPLAFLFGPTFLVHRLVSAISIILLLFSMYKIMRREGIDLIFILSALALFYSQLIMMITPLCRPDATGLFFFIIAIFYVSYFKTNKFNLFVGSLLALIAFLTKPYFGLAFPIIGFGLIFVDFKKALYFGIVGITMLVATVSLFTIYTDTFLSSHIYMHLQPGAGKFIWAFYQMFWYGKFYFGIVISGFYLLYLLLSKYLNKTKILTKQIFDLSCYDFKSNSLSFSINLSGLIIGLTLLILSLGRHSGQFMEYFFHLMTPFLIVCVGFLTRNSKGSLVTIILILNIVFINVFFNNLFVKIERDSDWDYIEKVFDEYDNVLAHSSMVGIAVKKGEAHNVISTGLNGFYERVLKSYSKESTEKIKNDFFKFKQFSKDLVRSRKYDIIFTSRGESVPWVDLEYVKENYKKVKEFSLKGYLKWQVVEIDVWKLK